MKRTIAIGEQNFLCLNMNCENSSYEKCIEKEKM